MKALVHRSALVLLALLMAVTSGSCIHATPGQPSETNPYPALATVEAEPALMLVVPGSVLIRTVGHERFTNITGWEAAFSGHVYGTSLTIDEVYSYFDRELLRLGWKRDRKPLLSSGELRGWGWCKPTLFFRLAIFDPEEYDRVAVPDGAKYTSVYDARIQGTDAQCPRT